MSDYSVSDVLSQMIRAAVKAGKVILDFYHSSFSAWSKSDSTPVTEADLAASDIIINTLKERFEDSAILCEETAETLDASGRPARMSADHIFIIDPLDGTRSFMNGSDQFAVSVSYVEGHIGKAAVIFAPAQGKLYYAAKGQGAWRVIEPSEDHVPFAAEQIHVSDRTDGLVALMGNAENDPEGAQLIKKNSSRISEVIKVSSCIKGCMIAEGTADIHYKFASYTKEWDTSAEEIICREAGGIVTDVYGGELISNRPDPQNRRGIRILNNIASALDISLK